MPYTRDAAPPGRSWGSRLGEGLVMSISMLLLRLIAIWAHLFPREPFSATVVAALLFGACWVVIALVWDLVRGRRAR